MWRQQEAKHTQDFLTRDWLQCFGSFVVWAPNAWRTWPRAFGCQWYLYDKIRSFCPSESQDITCPMPTDPRPTSRRGTPVTTPPPESPQPPAKKRRCGVCRKAGHVRTVCPERDWSYFLYLFIHTFTLHMYVNTVRLLFDLQKVLSVHKLTWTMTALLLALEHGLYSFTQVQYSKAQVWICCAPHCPTSSGISPLSSTNTKGYYL